MQQDGFAELYNLRADPCELHNLIDNAAAADTARGMWRALARLIDEHGDSDPRAETIRRATQACS